MIFSTVPLFFHCYCVIYSLCFFKVVKKNFKRVSRSKVLSRMIFANDLPVNNEFLEISSKLMMELKERTAKISERGVSVEDIKLELGVEVDKTKIMVYSDGFPKYLDNYRAGFTSRAVWAVIMAAIFLVNLVVTILSAGKA